MFCADSQCFEYPREQPVRGKLCFVRKVSALYNQEAACLSTECQCFIYQYGITRACLYIGVYLILFADSEKVELNSCK